ncbi:MAG: hypothetical protein EAZ27_09585 [Cytophagales bacterium]|nr:MAG: hypothetical protein EAZ27_09585 [Cytophagales bacterium]
MLNLRLNIVTGTPKNLNSVEALPLGFCGFVAEIGLGGVFKNNIRVFKGSLTLKLIYLVY